MIGYYVMVSNSELDGLVNGALVLEDFLSVAIADEDICLDIDKAWHGIQYLLCGSLEEGEKPLFDAVLGGTPVNDDEMGLGPVRSLSAEEVRVVYDAVKPIDLLAFKQVFVDSVLGNESVYPGFSDGEDINYLDYYFEKLKDFFGRCVGRGMAMVMYIG